MQTTLRFVCTAQLGRYVVNILSRIKELAIMKNNDIKRTILYYPTISIPSGTWLRQALLYWDEIGSIVPKNWDNEILISLGPDIEYLKNEGEFRPFDPQELIKQAKGLQERQEFEKEFKSIIESPLFQKILDGKNIILSSNVHRDKVSKGLFYDFLQPEGLADFDKTNYDWYLFEENTALLYMSLLAKYISDIDIQATVAGTDRAEYQNLIYAISSKNEGIACLDARFKNSLPIPRDDISLADIVDFKQKRRLELLNFRKILNDFQNRLSKANETKEINEIVIDFKEALEKGVSDISALMQDSRISTIAGSLKTIFNIKSPTLIGTFGVTAGYATKISELPVEWTIAGLGTLGLIEIGCHMIDKRNQKRATLRDSPFSYLYHSKQEGLILNPI